MQQNLILSDTDANRQFTPEDVPRAGEKMQASVGKQIKAAKGSNHRE